MQPENVTVNSFAKGSFDKCDVNGVRHFKSIPVLSIVQSTEGYYEFGIQEAPLTVVAEGDFFIAPAFADQNILHHASTKTGLMSARWVFMDIVLDNIYSFDALYRYPSFPDEMTAMRLRGLFDELFCTDDVIESKILCYRLVQTLMDISTLKRKSNPYVQAALRYMETNYARPLSVAEIADTVGLSHSRLYALFHTHLKLSPIAQLNQLRLSKACLLLENTDRPIREIAESCGIADVFYFSKSFKKKYNVSPREYRRNLHFLKG